MTGFIVPKTSVYLKNQASNDLLSLTRVAFLEPGGGAAEGGCDVGAEGGDVATRPSPDESKGVAKGCCDVGAEGRDVVTEPSPDETEEEADSGELADF